MAKHSAFVEYLENEALAHITGISVRPMFGGYGMYRDGIIFGLIGDDALYLKVDAENLPDFQAIDSKKFTVMMKGKEASMNYWFLPEHIIEDREQVSQWIEKSIQVSIRAKKK